MRATVVLALSIVLILSPLVQNDENVDVADIAIAVEATKHNQQIDSAFKAFFDEFAARTTISHDKIRISVVQYSDAVHVLIPFRDGTSSEAIKKVTLDSQKISTNKMDSRRIALSVREKAFVPSLGSRWHVPRVVIVIARLDSTGNQAFDEWKKEADPEAERIAFGVAADVVQIVNTFDDLQDFFVYSRTSAFWKTETHEWRSAQQSTVFKNMSNDARDRMEEALRGCPYTKVTGTACYYSLDRQCVVDVYIKPEDGVSVERRKYCLRDTTEACPNGDQGCEDQCEHVSSWSACSATQCGVEGYRMRQPSNISDHNAVFIYERCLKFENYAKLAESCVASTCPQSNTTTSATPTPITTSTGPGGAGKGWQCGVGTGFVKAMTACTPAWLTIVVALICLLLAFLITYFISRKVYERRLASEALRQRRDPACLKHKAGHHDDTSGSKKTPMMKSGLDESNKSSFGKLISPPTSVDLRSRPIASPVSKLPSMSKTPGMVTSPGGRSSEGSSGGWTVERPPSLTGRTIDELYDSYGKKKNSTPLSSQAPAGHKTGVRSVAKPSMASPKAKAKMARSIKKSYMMQSKGYRS